MFGSSSPIRRIIDCVSPILAVNSTRERRTKRSARVTSGSGRIALVGAVAALLIAAGCTNSKTNTIGPPAKLAITQQPTNTAAGSSVTPAVQVSVEDSNGNVTSSTDMITIAIGTNPSAGTLSGTLSVPAVAGIATFSGLSINNPGSGYMLTVSDTTTATVTGATSNAFTVFGVAAKLVVTTSPNNSTGGVAFATQPVVTVEDSGGRTVINSSLAITLAITAGTGTGGATFGCTSNTITVSAGVATFSGCKINFVGNGYTLTATGGGFTSAASGAFNIAAGPAATLAFAVSPSNSTGGIAFATQPIVNVLDAGGNVSTGSTTSITLAITAGTGAAGAALTCTGNTVVAVAGVATFGGCKINFAASGYTLTATGGGFTSLASTAFNISVGAASQISFTIQPGGGTGGTTWAQQPVVTVEDAGGNTVTGSTIAITLAITTNPGSGTLTCNSNPQNAVAGVASFVGCKINKVANGYVLTATGGGFTSPGSNAFNISTGAASQLSFTTQPGGGTGGTPWTQQPVVTVEDAGGNTVTNSTIAITLSITSGTGAASAALTCTNNGAAAVAGVGTFAGCKINLASVNTYTLTASGAGGLAGPPSASFTISVGAASQLAFANPQPNGGQAATPWTQQPIVTVEDAGGNTVTSSTLSISLAITSGTGATGAVLTCSPNPQTAAAGVATFVGCQINLSGNGYTLTATGGGFTSAPSSAFSINAGPATQLQFIVQPVTTPQNTNIAPAIKVAVEDTQNNVVTTSTISITLAITSGTGTGGAALSGCTNPANTISGVATFTGCQINDVGTNYTLTATGGGFTTPASNLFNITVQLGPTSKIVITTSPNGGTGGIPWSTQPVVTVEDSNGNTETGSTISITLAITGGTGSGGAALRCSNNTVSAVAGIATFSGCEINLMGNGYTLTATGGGFTSTPSTAFNISLGPASQLVFTTEPGGGNSNTIWSQQPVVTVEDAGGNTETGSTTSITLSITGSPAGAALSCSNNTVSAIAGVAAFAGCQINNNGNYTLTATGGGLNGTSANFNIGNSLPASCTGAPSGFEHLVTGPWAFLVQGWTGSGSGSPFAAIFALNANGTDNGGALTAAGQLDENNGANGASSYLTATINQSNAAGASAYVVGPDSTGSGYVGCMTLAITNNSTNATTLIHFRFSLGGFNGANPATSATRASKATIIGWDDTTGTGTRASGVGLPQDSSEFHLSSLATSYALGLDGVDTSGGHFAEAGSSTLNTTTGTVAFEFDGNDAGVGLGSGGLTLVTGGTGTVSSTFSANGRGTFSSSVTIGGQLENFTNTIYVVNTNEIFILPQQAFGGMNSGPVLVGRLIKTGHGSFSAISGNLMIHLSGINTVAGNGGCNNNSVQVNCADVNLVVLTSTTTGAQTSSIAGFSWEYSQGRTVSANAISSITATVDATWGRLSISGTNANQAPVFYLATPVTSGSDQTEPFLAFGAGSGATAGNIDSTGLFGFVEAGATSLTQASIAGNYFVGTEDPSDNSVSDEEGVVGLSSSGSITGSSDKSGSNGLQTGAISGAVTVTNHDPCTPADTFPGLANTGTGTVGVANGLGRFIFFDTGSSCGNAGTSDAKFQVVTLQ